MVVVTSEATVVVVVASFEAMVVVVAGAFGSTVVVVVVALGSAVVVVPVTVAPFPVIVVVVTVVVVVVVVVVVMIMQFGHFDGAFQLPPFPQRGLMSESGKKTKSLSLGKSKLYPTKDGIAVVACAVEVCKLYGLGPVANQPGRQRSVPTNYSCTEKMRNSNRPDHKCDLWQLKNYINHKNPHLSLESVVIHRTSSGEQVTGDLHAGQPGSGTLQRYLHLIFRCVC